MNFAIDAKIWDEITEPDQREQDPTQADQKAVQIDPKDPKYKRLGVENAIENDKMCYFLFIYSRVSSR